MLFILTGLSDVDGTITGDVQADNNNRATTVIMFTFPAFRKSCNVIDIVKISVVSVARCQ